ncbi:hypothetical protein V1511DRAFT_504101 [Dipodascopsis uninucleata]
MSIMKCPLYFFCICHLTLCQGLSILKCCVVRLLVRVCDLKPTQDLEYFTIFRPLEISKISYTCNSAYVLFF